jgi:hypothetical protein
MAEGGFRHDIEGIGRLNSLAMDLEYRYFTGFLNDFS